MKHLALALALSSLALVPEALAQPARCERAQRGEVWPATDEGTSIAAARAQVVAFRRAWRRIRPNDPTLRAMTVCMRSSFEHFVVRRVPVSEAQARLEWLRQQGFTASILAGGVLRGDTVWEVHWGGSLRRHPRTGTIGGFLADDGSLLAAVYWPEG